MPKKFLRKFIPDPERLKNDKNMALLGQWLHDPNIWHLNKNSVARGFSVGLFCAFVPIPLQMLLAAFVAVLVRANLPIAVTLVWITNPITLPPIFYFAYKLGNLLLNEEIVPLRFQFSLEMIAIKITHIWKPFLLGCLVLGITFAAVGNLAMRLLWRTVIIHNWRKRRQQRRSNELSE